ncbi:MAG: type II toxin-antitoxin system PemK/MazF family toxin [Verrucomicrobiota bacterium]
MPKAKRGDICMADLGMIAKVRPVLILSVEYQDNERAVVTYVVRTTSTRDTQYEVPHEERGMKGGAFDAQGMVTIPDVKLERRISRVSTETMAEVETAVRHWLAL